ncbi:hypothetical protein [Morganella phage Mecenats66]|nr:hypothetical protein [Morganella phage Mecenats66]
MSDIKNRSIEIANIILSQLGGNRFIAMTGAKQMVAVTDGLQLKLPARFAAKGINCLQVILLPSDTYRMRFLKVSKMNCKTVSEFDDVYCDQLQNIFTSETGLNTHL